MEKREREKGQSYVLHIHKRYYTGTPTTLSNWPSQTFFYYYYYDYGYVDVDFIHCTYMYAHADLAKFCCNHMQNSKCQNFVRIFFLDDIFWTQTSATAEACKPHIQTSFKFPKKRSKKQINYFITMYNI